MIIYRDAWLEAFYLKSTPHKKIPANITNVLPRKLQLVTAATCEADLRIPPRNCFEHLSGKLNDWCSIRVNDQYRLIFKWIVPDAIELYLDKHEYR